MCRCVFVLLETMFATVSLESLVDAGFLVFLETEFLGFLWFLGS